MPDGLGTTFSVRSARQAGVPEHRLRSSDMQSPFHGVRVRTTAARASGATGLDPSDTPADDDLEPHEREHLAVIQLAKAYATRMPSREFFSHGTAAHLWNAPIPLGSGHEIHVSTFRPCRSPRARGIAGHEVLPGLATVTTLQGLPLTTPASTWAMLGTFGIDDLVVLGDYFVRTWRNGYLRPHSGRRPLATIEELRSALNAGRRAGAKRLREALTLIREDSWSPMETRLRLLLVRAGLPEPVLNLDLFDDFGDFLGCVDLCYPEHRVAIEYQGMLHGKQYARDIERVERLRNAGWTVIQVTWPLLFERPAELVRRVERSLAGSHPSL